MAIARADAGPPPRTVAVGALLTRSVIARMPEAALALLLVLRVRDLGGSYALVGAVSAVLGAGWTVGAPVLGRLVDRRGQTGVLVVSALVAAAAIAAAGLLPAGTPPTALLPLALVAGLATPPLAPCLRALLGQLLEGRARHRALALESALQQVSFTAGPLVFVTVLGGLSPGFGLVGAAAGMLAGTLAFAALPESRGMTARRAEGQRGGALGSTGIRTLLGCVVGVGGMIGATEVALAAAAEREGGAVVLGILLAVWSGPPLVAGLIVARRGTPADPVRALVVLAVAMGLSTAALGLPPDLWTLGVLLAASGALSAPLFTMVYSLAAVVAIPGTVTEAFTWLKAGLFAGIALGGGAAGLLIALSGVEAAFAAAGASCVLAGLVVAFGDTGLPARA